MDELTPRQPTAPASSRLPPREVRIATGLLFALGAVMTLNAIAALVFRGDIARSAQDDMAVVIPADQLSTLLTVASVLLLVLGTLHVLAGVYVRRGRQWARVVAFVAAGAVMVISGVGALAGAGLLAVALLGAGVGVVSLLMQSAASLWFAPPPVASTPSRPDGWT
ncbi:MAG: hypothetical protein H0T85_07725 [Geodermatophilaceae bacterium]|nr:hypothetical protein [Geodermatophilaceae bacterium]